MLIKYSGKYVKIYFNMKITYFSCSHSSMAVPLRSEGLASVLRRFVPSHLSLVS